MQIWECPFCGFEDILQFEVEDHIKWEHCPTPTLKIIENAHEEVNKIKKILN